MEGGKQLYSWLIGGLLIAAGIMAYQLISAGVR